MEDFSSEPAVKVELDGAIATITLNRPASRNSIAGSEMIEALTDAIVSVDADPAIAVAILTGAGSAFCAGGDIRAMQPVAGGPVDVAPARTRTNYRTGIQQIPLTFERLEIPMIAAVNGPAIGAGCDLTTMCDIRIASESAVFASSFVKLGLIPGDGGAWLLPRAIGQSNAAEMLFTGDPIDAQQALAFGLVSRVVPADQLMGKALEIAGRIAGNSIPALRMAKALAREARTATLAQTLELSAAFQAIAHTTDGHSAAMRKMTERLKPRG